MGTSFMYGIDRSVQIKPSNFGKLLSNLSTCFATIKVFPQCMEERLPPPTKIGLQKLADGHGFPPRSARYSTIILAASNVRKTILEDGVKH